jgi:UDP-GlcNAc:undecaprenyl-phosphate/decaprenyl-phosphate GlcNAc-1-phosphate transferase
MFAALVNLDFKTKQSLVICASLLLAVAIAFVATPFAIKFARKIGAVDVPADERRMHNHPIPLLGGLAIIIAFVVTSIVMMRYHHLLWQILPGALMIAVLGVIDDKHRLPALPKLFIQCIAAGIPIYMNNRIVINSISLNFLGIHTIKFPFFIAIVLTILWIVGITNAVNFVDGLDGLAAGISTIASISMMLIAYIKMGSDSNEYGIAILAAALAGGCLGLLPYNRNPAKIFMGDTGSTFLGYTLAVISIQGLFKAYTVISFAVPILVLGLPILDTIIAIIRRLIEGKSPFAADRSHIHHKLVDMGLDQKQAVGLLYIVSAIMGIVAVIFATFGSSTGWLVLIGAVALIGIICILTIPICKRYNTFDSDDFSDDSQENQKTEETSEDKKTAYEEQESAPEKQEDTEKFDSEQQPERKQANDDTEE